MLSWGGNVLKNRNDLRVPAETAETWLEFGSSSRNRNDQIRAEKTEASHTTNGAPDRTNYKKKQSQPGNISQSDRQEVTSHGMAVEAAGRLLWIGRMMKVERASSSSVWFLVAACLQTRNRAQWESNSERANTTYWYQYWIQGDFTDSSLLLGRMSFCADNSQHKKSDAVWRRPIRALISCKNGGVKEGWFTGPSSACHTPAAVGVFLGVLYNSVLTVCVCLWWGGVAVCYI